MTVTRWIVGLMLVVAMACAGPTTSRVAKAAVLRIGLTSDSPPLAFRQGDELTGLEVDLGQRLARDLGRPVRFVELRWDHLIPALLDDRIDVIMSGMTVTQARQFRVAFADPYLESGMVALVRRRDEGRYTSAEQVLATTGLVGARKGTTAEKLVRERMKNATLAIYPTSAAAALELPQRRIDMFISDAPIVAWLVSENESELAGVWKLLTDDELAWAFRPGDDALRTAANDVLVRWKADGTLKASLRRWLRGWPGLD